MSGVPVQMDQILKIFDNADRSEHSRLARPPHPVDAFQRARWNEPFEAILARKYGTFSFSLPELSRREDVVWVCSTMDPASLNQTIAAASTLLEQQESCLLASMTLQGPLPRVWQAADSEWRRKLTLRGLDHGARVTPRFQSRLSCPELTLEGLIGDGPYGFLGLCDAFTGACRVGELFYFEHPFVAHEYRLAEDSPDILRAFIFCTKTLRTAYIVSTLLGILNEFHQIPPPSPSATAAVIISPPKAVRMRGRSQRTIQAQAEMFGVQFNPPRTPEATPACYSCRRAVDRALLKRCGRCRLVWYCSVQCQTKDWPTHKRVCAKEDFDPQRFAAYFSA
ncbi:hypothetical protein B0H14DRAFT_3018232 [Mycena olivaceomarginata]|nr:hypothetical protein B0H14DRAFT_3018232 [Mycena olivaceomarginata]